MPSGKVVALVCHDGLKVSFCLVFSI